jgi:excisionase family DNA binding protein
MSIYNERLTLSVQETCSTLGLSRTTLYELIAEGRLKRIKIGRRALITVDSINRLLTQA